MPACRSVLISGIKVFLTAAASVVMLSATSGSALAEAPAPTDTPNPGQIPQPTISQGGPVQGTVQPCAMKALGITDSDHSQQGSQVYQVIARQEYQQLYGAAVACLPPDRRAELGPALQQEARTAGSDPVAYTEFVDHVLWAITGQSAVDAWLAPPGPQGLNLPTLAETYPASAYYLHIDDGSMLTHPWMPIISAVASVSMTFLATVASLLVRLTLWTMTMDITQPAGGAIGSGVGALQTGLYQPLLPAIAGLIGLWLLWKARADRRVSMTWSAVGWVVAVLGVAAIYAAIPAQIAQTADQYTTALSQVALGASANVDPAVRSQADETVTGPPQAAALRVYMNRWWQQNVYGPWTLAEFGTMEPKSPDGKRALGVEALADELLTGDTADFSGSSCQHGPVSTPGCDTSSDFQNQPQWLKDWFNGDNPGRLGFVLLGEIGFIAGALVLLIIAGTVAVAQLVFLFCVLGAPMVFLAGLHPTFGRAVLMRWLDVTLGALVIRVAYSLLLGLLLITDSTVAAGFAGAGWGVVMLLQAAAAVALLVLRRRLFRSTMGALQASRLMGAVDLGERHAYKRGQDVWSQRMRAAGVFMGGAGWARRQRRRAAAEDAQEPPEDWEEPGVRDAEWREVAQPALRAMPYNPLGSPGGGPSGGMPPAPGGGLPPPGLAPGPAPAAAGGAESGVAALGGGGGAIAASGAGGTTGAAVGAEAAAASSGAAVPVVAAAYVAAKAGAVARKTARAYPTAVATDIGSGLGVLPGPVDDAHATARPGPMPAPESPTESTDAVVDMVRGEDGKWYPWRSGRGESS